MNATTLAHSAILAASLCALSAPAYAQQALQRSADTPSLRTLEKKKVPEQQKAPAVTTESILLNPQPLPPTPPDPIKQVTPSVTQPAGRPGPAVLPDNLFELNDRAIIVVGGKQMQAAQVKREISAELERLSGPPVTVRSAARPGTEAATELGGPKASVPRRRANVPVTAGPAGVPASQGPSREIMQTTVTAGEMIDYCKKNPAKVLRVNGPLRPQQSFTIQGECFGDRSGTVEVSGLPGKVLFSEWSNHRIVATLPAVRGHTDKPVNLTVVRADKARTAPAQASFVALRERVEVPAHKWGPNGNHRRQFASATTGGTFHDGSIDPGGEMFRLAVNPACALVDAAWTQRVGRVTAFNGWDQGPPHAADVAIEWASKCVTSTTSFVFPLSSSRICEIAFDLQAWANCPLGVAP
jgi:hypothetical protein